MAVLGIGIQKASVYGTGKRDSELGVQQMKALTAPPCKKQITITRYTNNYALYSHEITKRHVPPNALHEDRC